MLHFTPAHFAGTLDRFKRNNAKTAELTPEQQNANRVQEAWQQSAHELTTRLQLPFLKNRTYGTVTRLDILRAIQEGTAEVRNTKPADHEFTEKDLGELIQDPLTDVGISYLEDYKLVTRSEVKSRVYGRYTRALNLTDLGLKALAELNGGKGALERFRKASAAYNQLTPEQQTARLTDDTWDQFGAELTSKLKMPFFQNETYGKVTRLDILRVIQEGIEEVQAKPVTDLEFTVKDMRALIQDPYVDYGIDSLQEMKLVTKSEVKRRIYDQYTQALNLTDLGRKALAVLAE